MANKTQPADFTGAQVRAARQKAGLTQSAFADLAGMRQATVSEIEHDKREPSEMTRIRVAKLLARLERLALKKRGRK